MKTTIDVQNRKEGEHIKLGLSDPSVRAFVQIMGALSTLPSQRAKERVMAYVQDYFAELYTERASEKKDGG